MIDLVAAEFLKLRTTRSAWVLIGLSLAFVVLTTVAQLATSLPEDHSDARSLLSNISIGGLLLLILGAVNAAGEYRHGTITSTFLLAPDRRRVVVAKALAHGLTGVLVALASTALVLAISLPWLSAEGESLGSLGVDGAELAGLVASMTAFVAINVMLGVGIGALLTNQVAAVIVVPVLIFVIDPIVVALYEPYGRFSLSGLWSSLTAGSSDDAGFDIFGAGPAALIYFGYMAAVIAVTAAIAQRRDVS